MINDLIFINLYTLHFRTSALLRENGDGALFYSAQVGLKLGPKPVLVRHGASVADAPTPPASPPGPPPPPPPPPRL